MRKIVRGGGLKANTLKSLLKSTYDRSPVEGWNRVMNTPELSAFEHPSGQVVIALRGTEGTAKDWSNNAVYGLAGESAYKLTPRYKRAKERVAELEKKYNPEDISLVGHSQGALKQKSCHLMLASGLLSIKRVDLRMHYLDEGKKVNMILERGLTQYLFSHYKKVITPLMVLV